MSSLSPLLNSYDLNGLSLPNRAVMAPTTRSRAPLRGRRQRRLYRHPFLAAAGQHARPDATQP
ncbi:hypothetical protein [Paraburkholderia phytofirmans]|uniref:NADH:flavin oxidoreductase/NADH oxidase n=1 Tax=Paraburkholderia phytofirmans (strain DSM 17436 / LMG 22146 / PsJN) TaxID=398527 RepID=B2TGL2_PARPJ|nr:hypothetical protein [Paraburkholderia phytofirmans]ACD19859.1 hypothetical protein Bphyt_5503 [Paraburkholderia phytofirmans PsJN]